MPSLKHSPVPARNKELAALQATTDGIFARRCLAALVLIAAMAATFDSEAATTATATATATNTATALSGSNSKALTSEAVTELSVAASTHANLFPQGVPYTVKPLNCKTDAECEKKADRKIASLEKQIAAAKKSIGKHGAAILKMNDKLQAMQKEIASLQELPAIESLKDADAGMK